MQRIHLFCNFQFSLILASTAIIWSEVASSGFMSNSVISGINSSSEDIFRIMTSNSIKVNSFLTSSSLQDWIGL